MTPNNYTVNSKNPAPAWAWVVGIAALVLFIMALVATQLPGEKAKAEERQAIDQCWKDQARKSLAPSVARFAASTCERMEDDYRQKHGTAP